MRERSVALDDHRQEPEQESYWRRGHAKTTWEPSASSPVPTRRNLPRVGRTVVWTTVLSIVTAALFNLFATEDYYEAYFRLPLLAPKPAPPFWVAEPVLFVAAVVAANVVIALLILIARHLEGGE